MSTELTQFRSLTESHPIDVKVWRSLKLLKIEMVICATIAAGALVPVYYDHIGVGAGWIGTTQAIFTVIGSELGRAFSPNISIPWKFILPACLILIGLLGMSTGLTYATVSLYGLLAISEGWLKAVMIPVIQEFAPDADQTTVLSLDEQLYQLLYIPLVFGLPLIGMQFIWETMTAVAFVLFSGATLFISTKLLRVFPRPKMTWKSSWFAIRINTPRLALLVSECV